MKYQVSGLVTVSCNTTVEADSKEEALEIGKKRALADLCHNPHVEDADECFQMEADGSPTEFTVDYYDDEEDDY